MVTIVKTIQPMQEKQPAGLILDIEAESFGAFDISDEIIHSKLTEMKWLKNKVFFELITDTAKDMFI